jgi:hypothetical protein
MTQLKLRPTSTNDLSIHIFRRDFKFLALFPHVLQILVAATRLSHVEGILSCLGLAAGIVLVVAYYPSKNGVSGAVNIPCQISTPIQIS